MDDSPTTKMTVYISKDVHRDIKIHAAKTGQTISSIAEEALRRYLEEVEQASK